MLFIFLSATRYSRKTLSRPPARSHYCSRLQATDHRRTKVEKQQTRCHLALPLCSRLTAWEVVTTRWWSVINYARRDVALARVGVCRLQRTTLCSHSEASSAGRGAMVKTSRPTAAAFTSAPLEWRRGSSPPPAPSRAPGGPCVCSQCGLEVCEAGRGVARVVCFQRGALRMC